jgi:hypothetical protein
MIDKKENNAEYSNNINRATTRSFAGRHVPVTEIIRIHDGGGKYFCHLRAKTRPRIAESGDATLKNRWKSTTLTMATDHRQSV